VEVPPSKSLGLNHYKDGDVGVGVFVEMRLLRKADPAYKALEARVGAKRVKPEIGLEEERVSGDLSC
jgi:hypothetical protein